MGKEWLFWVGGGGGGGGNSRSSSKRDKTAGCIFHLFHFHFPSTHRNTSYPFLQEEPTTAGVEAPRNSLERQEQDLNFPVGIKIKTSKEISPECDDSPGTKTPSVVARLMGLDLLPQCTQIDAARSLPETPRTSSSSRKSDVERHRLSLQISNKENSDYHGGRRFDSKIRSRSVGLDITNIHRNNHSKKISKISPKHGGEKVMKQSTIKESKKIRVKKLAASRREDGFVGCRERERSKTHLAKRAPLSCDTRNVRGRVKIGPPPTKLPPKQSQVSNSWKSSAQLSSKASQSYSQVQLRQDKTPTTVSACTTKGAGVWPDHRNYIQMILKHTAIAKWHAPSQPIDPGIFHHLEHKAVAGLSRRSERKLVFQLVDELLGEILTRHFKLNPPSGSRLVEELCKKIASFPAAKCEVLEDIDSLIDKDFCKAQWNGFWGGEEEIVSEIEAEMVEWLVTEAVAVMGGYAAEEF